MRDLSEETLVALMAAMIRSSSDITGPVSLSTTGIRRAVSEKQDRSARLALDLLDRVRAHRRARAEAGSRGGP